MTAEIFEVRHHDKPVIRTADEGNAQCAYDVLVRHNEPVEMWSGLDAGGGVIVEWEKVDSFEAEEATEPGSNPREHDDDHARDMGGAR